MEIVILMVPTSIIFTSHQELTIYHIFNVCYLILLCLEESGLILMDNLSTVTTVIELIHFSVMSLILQLTSLYTDLVLIIFVNLILVVMSLSVVYPIVVLIHYIHFIVYIVDFFINLSGIIIILNLIVDHHKMNTDVILVEYKPYIVVTVQSFVHLLLHVMQKRSVMEYLVSQTIMVIMYIDVM